MQCIVDRERFPGNPRISGLSGQLWNRGWGYLIRSVHLRSVLRSMYGVGGQLGHQAPLQLIATAVDATAESRLRTRLSMQDICDALQLYRIIGSRSICHAPERPSRVDPRNPRIYEKWAMPKTV